ncbi:MAG: ROK family protein [Chitinivibrionales bacterium]|nr:ROK family protein [Chitinivibrionales bacterium]
METEILKDNHQTKTYIMGFDLGGTKMLAILLDEKMRILHKKKVKVKAGEGVKKNFALLISAIVETCTEIPITPKQLSAIGIGVPGSVDFNNGIVLSAPNVGWVNVRLRDMLQKEFPCAVSVINDVDAGVYGEYRLGAAQNCRCVVGIFPGTGIGGGCIYEGKIFRGERTSSMEIGHIQVIPNGPLCGCGGRGCLEAVASRLSIAADAAKAAYRGEAPHLFEIAGTDIKKIRSSSLKASIQAGDKAVERIVRDAAQWLGVAAASVINVLTPDTILLGGGLVEAMPDIFRETIEETARLKVMPEYKNTFKVVVSKLGDDATAVGAAAWAVDTLQSLK